jgi:hypothetical protein
LSSKTPTIGMLLRSSDKTFMTIAHLTDSVA